VAEERYRNLNPAFSLYIDYHIQAGHEPTSVCLPKSPHRSEWPDEYGVEGRTPALVKKTPFGWNYGGR
jgi:hypothetical protein